MLRYRATIETVLRMNVPVTVTKGNSKPSIPATTSECLGAAAGLRPVGKHGRISIVQVARDNTDSA
jgi:hypothetical protein